MDWTSIRHAHRQSDDGDLRSRLREIASEHRCFGYQRLGIMLAREGLVMNHEKLLRLYREENLRVMPPCERPLFMRLLIPRKEFAEAACGVTGDAG